MVWFKGGDYVIILQKKDIYVDKKLQLGSSGYGKCFNSTHLIFFFLFIILRDHTMMPSYPIIINSNIRYVKSNHPTPIFL